MARAPVSIFPNQREAHRNSVVGVVCTVRTILDFPRDGNRHPREAIRWYWQHSMLLTKALRYSITYRSRADQTYVHPHTADVSSSS
jgi:hypothetical protein